MTTRHGIPTTPPEDNPKSRIERAGENNAGDLKNTDTETGAVSDGSPSGAAKSGPDSGSRSAPVPKSERAKVPRSRKEKRTIGIVAAIAVLAIGATSLFVFKPALFHKESELGGPTSSASAPVASGQHTEPGQGPGDDNKQFWEAKGKKYPVQLADWQTKPADSYESIQDSAERSSAKADLDEKVSNYNLSIPGVNSNLQALPSRSNGFTDDPKQVLLADGSLNPKYSYWTLEGFNENVNTTLQRFVNPDFGGWGTYQYSAAKGSINKPEQLQANFVSSFDPAFVQKVANSPLKSWLPVYADWDGNDYGMGNTLLAYPGPRWMGSLDSVATTFKFNEQDQTYTAHVVANVTYEAWTQDQKVTKKHGVIAFDVVSGGTDGSGDVNASSNRYMLSNSTLEMKA